MSWLIGHWTDLGTVAGKAVLMYAVALFGLRVGERRTMAQWTVIDFSTAVAMGAIVGRTAIATSQSFIVGAVALVTLIAVHRVASTLRFSTSVRRLFDHRVRVLVHRGQIRRRELRIGGLTEDDLYSQLRQRGVFSLDDLRYVLYEPKGSLTVVRESEMNGDQPALVKAAIGGATGFDDRR